MTNPNTYFENARGIKVTADTLSTRYKDEALAPIQSVQIGREPLFIGCISGLGLILFCYQFGDLLYLTEKLAMTLLGSLMLFVGFSIAALRVGQYMHEKTVFWGTIWTVQEVRLAIAKARENAKENSAPAILVSSDQEQ